MKCDVKDFMSNTRYEGECLVWVGPRRGRYGVYHGMAARRVSWEMSHPPLRKSDVVTNTCDNPLCVRAEHLALKATSASVDTELGQVLGDICDMLGRLGEAKNISELARILGVAPSTVARWRTGESSARRPALSMLITVKGILQNVLERNEVAEVLWERLSKSRFAMEEVLKAAGFGNLFSSSLHMQRARKRAHSTTK